MATGAAVNKKLNTLLFILGATLFNILVTLLVLVLLIIIHAALANSLPDAANAWAFPLIFIAAIASAFVAYRFALNKLTSKIKFEDYFDPIIRGGRRPPPKKREE